MSLNSQVAGDGVRNMVIRVYRMLMKLASRLVSYREEVAGLRREIAVLRCYMDAQRDATSAILEDIYDYMTSKGVTHGKAS